MDERTYGYDYDERFFVKNNVELTEQDVVNELNALEQRIAEAKRERDKAQRYREALEFYMRGHECLDGKSPTPSCPGLLKARAALADAAETGAKDA